MTPAALRNVHACLVHESAECVLDLVRNLRYHDPASPILLYNGGTDPDLLRRGLALERYGAVVHPEPRPMRWGTLHGFALDAMRFALDAMPFDTLTIVDSDQLLLRAGYPERLAAALDGRSNVGMLGNAPGSHAGRDRPGPVAAAMAELETWLPFARRFPDGERKFPHWTFWPSTVFTADAAQALTKLLASDQQLQDLMRRTSIWATEEVILPTLVALLGYEIVANPCSYEFVRYRSTYSAADVDTALRREDAYWMHPVPRVYGDRIRQIIRQRHGHYATKRAADTPRAAEGGVMQTSRVTGGAPFLLTVPVLERMRQISGWLEDGEADLLMAAASDALARVPDAAVVEIGSYCGRSTVVLGSVVRHRGGGARVYAIDPHDGVVGALDQKIERTTPTLEAFRRNIAAAALTDVVETVIKQSYEVTWTAPIALLFIDGLHDYPNVARDFHHFDAWMAPGGYVAFHDYADYYPGVKAFVDELVQSGAWEMVARAHSLVVLRRIRETAGADVAVAADDEAGPAGEDAQSSDGPTPEVPEGQPVGAAPAVAARTSAALPLVSCLMPTADRRVFVPQAIQYFLRQTYEPRELIVLDDGLDAVDDLMPDDPRIRYVRLDGRRSTGAKHNLGAEMARGELVCHWDDDDWMAAERLRYQVAHLEQHPGPAVCGLSRLVFCDPRAARAWTYTYPAGERAWVAGGTFCYRKTLWHEHRFPDINEGADTLFVWGIAPDRIHALDDHRFYVALVHDGNTSRKQTAGPYWTPVPFETVERLWGEDAGFYTTWSLDAAGAACPVGAGAS